MILQEHAVPWHDVKAQWRQLAEFMYPVWVIAQREIKDTLRDWRIVLPIAILVTGFPFLANFAASRGIAFVNQYGAGLIIERLLPFLMLVVAFFPSSFSLVIALETFVGEKERRSLESLLATPLSNGQLYLGKLIASSVPPIIASYIGIIFYLVLLRVSLDWRPGFSLLLASFVMATAQTLVMVTGAVIVSSQSTSVRAANLLASFIIIPMTFLLQAQAGTLLFANYTALWMIALFLLVMTLLLLRLGIRLFDREHLLGRDIDQIDLPGIWHTFRDAALPKGPLSLYFQEIPRILRGTRTELWITVLTILIGGLIVGWWGTANFSLPVEAFALDDLLTVEGIQEAISATNLISEFSVRWIFVNNIRALLFAGFLGLFSMGVLAQLLLMTPIAIIAYVALQVGNIGINPWLFVAIFVLPHGIIELPAAIVATAQTMRMGDVILSPPEEQGGVLGVVREIGHFVKLFIFLVLPLLLLAAWLEVHITPRVVVHFLGA